MKNVLGSIKVIKRNDGRDISFIKELPEWFNLDNYHGITQLDLEGWINQLYFRQTLQEFLQRFVLTGIIKDCFISGILHKPSAQILNPISLRDSVILIEALKACQNIPSETWQSPSFFQLTTEKADIQKPQSLLEWFHDQNKLRPEEECLASKSNYTILQKYISVDLSASDAVLAAAFKKWLKERRILAPRHPKRVFSKSMLRRWAVNQVLPYIDLSYWAMLNEVQIPHWLMGEALFPGRQQGDKADRVRKTTESTAKEVMQSSCIHAMAAQLKFETGKVLDLAPYPHLETKSKIFVPPKK